MRTYTKEQTKKITELFETKAGKEKIEAYAKSISRDYNSVYQKYHKSKNKGKSTEKFYKPEQKEYIKENWSKMSKEERKTYAKSIGRSSKAIEKTYYRIKNRKNTTNTKSVIKKQKPAIIKVTHVNEPVEKQKAIAHIGSVRIEIPSNTLTIGEVKLEW